MQNKYQISIANILNNTPCPNRRLKLALLKAKQWLNAPNVDRMQVLRHMAGVVISYKKQKPIAARRRTFEKIKHMRFGAVAERTCDCCQGSNAHHRHHVIPLRNGGTNSRKNIVYLCAPCHERIHPFMQSGLLDRGA